LYNHAIIIYERLTTRENRRDLQGELAKACMNKAFAKIILEDHHAFETQCDHAIEVHEHLVERESRGMADILAMSYIGYFGDKLYNLDNLRDAEVLSDLAIEIYEKLVEQEGRHELRDELAKAYTI